MKHHHQCCSGSPVVEQSVGGASALEQEQRTLIFFVLVVFHLAMGQKRATKKPYWFKERPKPVVPRGFLSDPRPFCGFGSFVVVFVDFLFC